MIIPEEMKEINKFRQVKVLSNKDLYKRLGDRVPQPVQEKGVAFFDNTAIGQLRAGQKIASVLDHDVSPESSADEPAPVADSE